MGTRAHFGRRGGRRAVSDPEFRRQGLVAGAAAAVSMAIAACAAALARHTAGHDWYAAYRITVADLMIGAGFDKDVQVEYRNADGVVETVSRSRLSFDLDARWAREDILEAAWQGAALGGLCGLGGALLCLVLMWRSVNDAWAGRRGFEPAPAHRPRPHAGDRSASAPERPMSAPSAARLASLSSPSATTAPASKDRQPMSELPRPAEPDPAVMQQDESGIGKDDEAPAGRERRKRDYGRWV